MDSADARVQRVVDAIERPRMRVDDDKPVIMTVRFGKLSWLGRLLNKRTTLEIVFLPDSVHREDWVRTARQGDLLVLTCSRYEVMPDRWFDDRKLAQEGCVR